MTTCIPSGTGKIIRPPSRRERGGFRSSSRLSDVNLRSLCSSSGVLKLQRRNRPQFRVGAIRSSSLPCSIGGGGGPTRRFDFAVIGSGIAGLRYALEVAKHGSVAVVTKSEAHESNTNYAQGGVSAVLSPADSVESHVRDTIVAGAYLCDEETVRVVCEEGPERIRELIAIGASFDQNEDGDLHLGREGGHSHRRIVHKADMTGKEIQRALLEAVHNHPNIFVFQHHFAIDLLTLHDSSDIVCVGFDALNTKTLEVTRFMSKVTLLASGGAGHVYPTTTNPLVATGDGIAMAHRAQAVISNMEFVQFHPTALAEQALPSKSNHRGEKAFLISEAVRGEGGVLYNLGMERFMPHYDPRRELAPRDVVARSIDHQLKTRGDPHVLLDLTALPPAVTLSRFPGIAAECLSRGLDITRSPIPVVPAAHYLCGGVRSDLHAQTNLKGLFVAGESACSGLHGANRLASNSLLEALVFSLRAVPPSLRHSSGESDSGSPERWARREAGPAEEGGAGPTGRARREMQAVMWEKAGIVRTTRRLEEAEGRLREIEGRWVEEMGRLGWGPLSVGVEACEMRNLLCVAGLVVRSALARRESRGLHYNTDFPLPVESMRVPTVISPSDDDDDKKKKKKKKKGEEVAWSSREIHKQPIST